MYWVFKTWGNYSRRTLIKEIRKCFFGMAYMPLCSCKSFVKIAPILKRYIPEKNSNIQIEICTTGNTKINGALVRELFPSKKTKVAKFFHHWFICFLLDELTNDASLTFNYWTQHLTNLTYISFCIKCHLKWGKLFFALGEVTRLKFLK